MVGAGVTRRRSARCTPGTTTSAPPVLLAAMGDARGRPAGPGLVDGRLRRRPLLLPRARRPAAAGPRGWPRSRPATSRSAAPCAARRWPGGWSTRTPGWTPAAATPRASSRRSTMPPPGPGRPGAAVALRYHNVYGPGCRATRRTPGSPRSSARRSSAASRRGSSRTAGRCATSCTSTTLPGQRAGGRARCTTRRRSTFAAYNVCSGQPVAIADVAGPGGRGPAARRRARGHRRVPARRRAPHRRLARAAPRPSSGSPPRSRPSGWGSRALRHRAAAARLTQAVGQPVTTPVKSRCWTSSASDDLSGQRRRRQRGGQQRAGDRAARARTAARSARPRPCSSRTGRASDDRRAPPPTSSDHARVAPAPRRGAVDAAARAPRRQRVRR